MPPNVTDERLLDVAEYGTSLITKTLALIIYADRHDQMDELKTMLVEGVEK